MVQGMAFLSKKGFNPHNQVNRQAVYEAQQHSKLEQARLQKRAEELRREREEEELCAARHNGDGSQAQLRFMYDAPPGLKKKQEGQEGQEEQEPDGPEKLQQPAKSATVAVASASVPASASASSSNDVLTQVQPGDDPATVAFRRMLAAASNPIPEHADEGETTTNHSKNNYDNSSSSSKFRFGPVLQGSNLERQHLRGDNNNNNSNNKGNSVDARSALEKAVGRKDRDGGALTLQEQVARFPQLQHAPMAKGMSATDVNVSFKPLGAQLRNVKCLACGIWGHSRGDRECSQTGWDPFSSGGTNRMLTAAVTTATMLAEGITALPSSSIVPTQKESRRDKDHDERRRRRRKRRQRSSNYSSDEDSDSNSDSTSSSSRSSDDDGRRRKRRKHSSRKHSSKKRRKESASSSSRRKKHRKHYSSSDERRSKSDKQAKRPRRDDGD